MSPLGDPDAEQSNNVVDFLRYKARRSVLRSDATSDALLALAEAVAQDYGIGRVEKMLAVFCEERSPIKDAIVHRLLRFGFR